AGAIGWRSVDQIDAQVTGLVEQGAGGRVVGDSEAVRIFHTLVAAQFDGAQAKCRDSDAGVAQRAQEIAHASCPNRRYQTGLPGCARGSDAGSAGWGCAGVAWSRASSARTRSPRSGVRVSLVGQVTSRRPRASA